MVGKNLFTSVPQRVQFTDDNINSIGAAGTLAYCKVSGTIDLEKQDLPNPQFTTRTYMWGIIPKGLALKKQKQIHFVPTILKEIQQYSFSDVFIQNDFAMGVGHSVEL